MKEVVPNILNNRVPCLLQKAVGNLIEAVSIPEGSISPYCLRSGCYDYAAMETFFSSLKGEWTD